jgi:ATP/maltotriose-dependent transcriptional regulator MalT
MRQEMGNRMGEAATFYQLGILAGKNGKLAEGLQLVAICYLIELSIGHGDTDNDFRTLSEMASKLGYSEQQFDAMLREVAVSYERDQGQSLLDAAFK